MKFEDALAITLKFEGGYSNDPADPGGATNFGITQGTYNTYRNVWGLAEQPVKLITPDETTKIYKDGYWNSARCDIIALDSPRVAAFHFDTAVNVGTTQAARILQRAVGVAPDGVIGPVTLGVIKKLDENLVIDAYKQQRIKFYRDLCANKPNLTKFLNGWIIRTNRLTRILNDPP